MAVNSPNPKYLFPKTFLNKSPRLDNLAATPAAQKAEAQRILEPLLDVFTTIAGGPVKLALQAATYSPSAEAAFITPRSASAKLTKFADASLERIPNPAVTLPDSGSVLLHELYGKTKEGRDIINATGLPNIPVRMLDNMEPTSKGRAVFSPKGVPEAIELNLFPITSEFAPQKTLYHEVQHVIDKIQGRPYGTNLKEASGYLSDVKASELTRHMTPDSTIDKKKAAEIMQQESPDAYVKHTGEYRARLDAGQDTYVDIRDTWHYDPATKDFVTFPKE